MARLLIVSESKMMEVLLEVIFRRHAGAEIVGLARKVDEAMRLADMLKPDLVVIASGVALRQDAVGLAEGVYRANPHAVVVVSAPVLSAEVRKELLDVCAVPISCEVLDLPYVLEDLIPDLRVPAASNAG